MNSKNSGTPKPHILILKLNNKLNSRIGKMLLLYQILALLHMEKHKKLIQ